MKLQFLAPRNFAFLAVGVAGLLAGCAEKGPAEKAGEKLDNIGKDLDPRGPVERAGAKVDNAVGK